MSGLNLVSWLGGKSRLMEQIIKQIPPHHCYVELFAGACWVLLNKEKSPVEIINDINGELVNLYRVVQEHPNEFFRKIQFVLNSRDEFDRFKAQRADLMTDINRAVRFFYLLRNSYNAKITHQNFASNSFNPTRLNKLTLEETLGKVSTRLARVWIENLSYDKLISKFDRNESFYYVDPPYWDCEDYYGKGVFSKDDFGVLCELLEGIKGKFLMSINDVSEIRAMFKGFNIVEVETTYSVMAPQYRGGKVGELFIMNYEPIVPTNKLKLAQ